MNDFNNVSDKKKVEILLQFTIDKTMALNPSAAAILVFLQSSVRDGDEGDLATWVSFYAKQKFDKEYGEGKSAKVEELIDERKPKTKEEFISVLKELEVL